MREIFVLIPIIIPTLLYVVYKVWRIQADKHAAWKRGYNAALWAAKRADFAMKNAQARAVAFDKRGNQVTHFHLSIEHTPEEMQ